MRNNWMKECKNKNDYKGNKRCVRTYFYNRAFVADEKFLY